MPIAVISRSPILRPSYSASGGGGSTGLWAPNRPVGLTTVLDRQWNPSGDGVSGGVLPPPGLNGTDQFNMLWFPGETSVAPLIDTPANLTTTLGQTVPDLPTDGGSGNATCMAIRYTSGFTAGHKPVGIASNSVTPMDEMYVANWIFYPSNFNPNSNNIKWLFFAQNGGQNHVLMASSGAQGSEVGNWIATQGGGGSDNIGGNNNTKTGWTTRLTDANIPALKGQWVCQEWYMKMETNRGVSSDGICKFWLNNQLRGHWTNIRYNANGDTTGFDSIYLGPYYGGGGSNAPSAQFIGVGRLLVAGA